jgi:hypothetical protein
LNGISNFPQALGFWAGTVAFPRNQDAPELFSWNSESEFN